jgi:hypothetical protein
MVKDLVLNITSGESAAPDFERQFLDELVAEMTTFRGAFEQLLAVLSGYSSSESQALTSTAIEAMDGMNAALQLHTDVRGCLRTLLAQAHARVTFACGAFGMTPLPASPWKPATEMASGPVRDPVVAGPPPVGRLLAHLDLLFQRQGEGGGACDGAASCRTFSVARILLLVQASDALGARRQSHARRPAQLLVRR